MKKIIVKAENYLFLIPLLFVTIIKLPHLGIPYFWDEAWSYFPAVFKMYENGPSLLPGSLPLWDAKGHPLFFFFISSVWMKIVGTEVVMVHIFPLLISLSLLLSVFFTVKKISGRKAANIAITLLSVQSLFLAQATMLLPEMMVALFLVLLIATYSSEKYVWFVLIGSLMVLTKETSVIFIIAFALFHLIQHLKPGKESRKYIVQSVLIVVPVFIYIAFLILHKKEFGSYFFEDHVGYIKISTALVFKKLKTALSIVFIQYGRIAISAAIVAAIAYLVVKKTKIKQTNTIGLIFLLSAIFLVFSAMNFYTQRYMLGLIATFTMLAGIIFSQIKIRNTYVNTVVIAILVGIPLYYSLTKKSNADSDLGYVETVKVHKQMVNYCEEQGWINKPVSASFNMIFCLRNPHLGYTSSKDGFSEVANLKRFRQSEIFINESTSYDNRNELDSIKNEKRLIKRFELKHAWGEIYINK